VPHALSLITLQRPLLLLHSSITAIITAATKVLLDVHLTGCLAAEKILKENKKKEFLVQFAWRDGFPEFM
jgi:adenosine deaminase